MPVEIFCCYAREDQQLLHKLKAHLFPLQRRELITVWADTDINAGAEWESEIEKHLDTADIILLLISSDFMISDYCYSKEMKRAMERHERGDAIVIPIILRPVNWKGAAFGKLQILPANGKPVKSWSDIDEAFLDVVQGVQAAIEKINIFNFPTIAPLPLDYIQTRRHFYSESWNRQRRGLLILLLDQSEKMNQVITWQENQITLAQLATSVINDLLVSIIENASLDQMTGRRKDYCDIAIFGYNDLITPLLPHKTSLPISLSNLAANPLGQHIVQFAQYDPQALQEVMVEEMRYHWIKPLAQGNWTEMGLAFDAAYDVAQTWVNADSVRDQSFPPIVINITGGRQQGRTNDDLIQQARKLQNLHTDDGALLLFNCYIAKTTNQYLSFPNNINQLRSLQLSDEDQVGVQQLFEISSLVPSTMARRAQQISGRPLQSEARGFIYGASGQDLIKFLSWGTRQNVVLQRYRYIWPTVHEYDTALQNAPMTVYGSDIKFGKILKDVFGPIHLSLEEGKYICVYRIGDWVVKCFTGTPPPNIRERYQAINDYLEQHIHRLPFLVPQTWVERGVYINGKDWPLVKSLYVKHIPLGTFLRNMAFSHRRTVITKLAKQWLKIITVLESLKIAHGDLDITNVLVCRTLTGIKLRLIDFDCMYVPMLAGGELWEQGHEHFQPTEQGVRRFNNEMDRFSALVIYLSLIALAEEPLLWEKCNANDETKLLLSSEDFRNLETSKIYRLLRTMQDNQDLQKCLDELASSIMNLRMPRSLPEVLRSSKSIAIDLAPISTPELHAETIHGKPDSPSSSPVKASFKPIGQESPLPSLFEEDPLFIIPRSTNVRFFMLAKSGEQLQFSEDACVVSQDQTRFALCDGASSSALPRPWASLLGEQWLKVPIFGNQGIDSKSLTLWLEEPRLLWTKWVQEIWLPTVNERNRLTGDSLASQNVVQDILATGAAATFLGLEIDYKHTQWRATAIGDTCLFLISHSHNTAAPRLTPIMPLTQSISFNLTPPLVSSKMKSSVEHLLSNVLCRQGSYQPGDVLLMATDALAAWLIRQIEQGQSEWQELLSMHEPSHFARFIEALRDRSMIEKDDTTLVIIPL